MVLGPLFAMLYFHTEVDLGFDNFILSCPNMDLNIQHDRLSIQLFCGGNGWGESWAIFGPFDSNHPLPSTFLGRSTL